MKFKRLLTVALLLWGGSGCRLAHNAWLTTIAEPLHYPRNLDDTFSKKRFTSMAELALDEARANARAERDDYDCEPFSVDHERGFIAGFTEFLEAGGTGEPPTLPPRKYWRGRFQNPLGQRQILDWFDGYRHGVSVAQAGDYRAFVLVPLSDIPVIETEQMSYGVIKADNQVTHLNNDARSTVASPNPVDTKRLKDLEPSTISKLPAVPAADDIRKR